MANPYALDFNPLAQAFQNKAQVDLQRNRLAMDEERLGMEQERLGFERDQHPLRLQGLRLGNETAEQGLKRDREMLPLDIAGKRASNTNLGLQSTQIRQQIEDHAGKQIVGVMQNIQERLKASPNDMGAIADYRKIIMHPDYRDYVAKQGITLADPLGGAGRVIAGVRGYQDPVAAEAKLAEIAKDKAQAKLYESQADAGNFLPLPENSRGVLNKKTGAILGADTGDSAQRKFNESYAKDNAPKNLDEALKEYATAAESEETLRALGELAPYAKTGYTGPVPPEAMLTVRKMAASLGLANPDSIGPTELFHFLAQKGVFNLTSQLKPASNLDSMMAAKATASVQTDPSTLPLAIPVLRRIEERKMMSRELMSGFYRRGVAPTPGEMVEITRRLNRDLPLIAMDGVPGQLNGTASGPQIGKQVTDRLPQPGQAPSVTPTQQQLLSAPDNTRIGQYVIRGGKAYLEPSDARDGSQIMQPLPRNLPPGVGPELPAGYPAQRVQMRRAQEQAQAEARRTQQRAQISAQFEADARVLPQYEMARKYDGMRSMLDENQLLYLNEVISNMIRR